MIPFLLLALLAGPVEDSTPMPASAPAVVAVEVPVEVSRSAVSPSVEIVAEQRVGGTTVRLSSKEAGTVIARDWFVAPKIEDFEILPGLDGTQARLTTPHEGEFTVYLIASATENGKPKLLHTEKTFRFTKGDSSFAARVAGEDSKVAKATRKPEELLRKAMLAVESPTWDEDRHKIANAYRKATSLSDANRVASKVVPPTWKPVLDFVSGAIASLHKSEMLISNEDDCGALVLFADVLEGL